MEPPRSENPIPQAGSTGQRIGVYDYETLVGFLKESFERLYNTPAPDPQAIILLMTEDIQRYQRYELLNGKIS